MRKMIVNVHKQPSRRSRSHDTTYVKFLHKLKVKQHRKSDQFLRNHAMFSNAMQTRDCSEVWTRLIRDRGIAQQMFPRKCARNIYRSHKFPSDRHRTVGILSSRQGSTSGAHYALLQHRPGRMRFEKGCYSRVSRRVIVSPNNEHPSRPVDRM